MGRTRTATAAAVVMLALLLQLLAPLPLSRAEATPVCTGAGIILVLSDDGAPLPGHDRGDHCQFCLLPRPDALPGSAAIAPVPRRLAVAIPGAGLVTVMLPRAPFTPYAQRAPPTA